MVDANDMLLAATENGHMKEVLEAIDKGASVKVTDDFFKNTALHIASSKGYLDIVELLVEKGADILAKNGTDMTPIHLAARDGQTRVVSFLLKKVDKISSRVLMDIITVAKMSYTGKPEIVEMLYKYRAFNAEPSIDGLEEHDSDLILAAYSGDLEKMRDALKKGANLEVIDGRGMSPLIWASLRGKLESVKELVKQGANINSTNRAGWTPLFQASAGGHVEIVEFLIENGADPNMTTDYSETALMFAAREGYLEIVKELLEAGADPNISIESDDDENGRTALIWARIKGYPEIEEILEKAMS